MPDGLITSRPLQNEATGIDLQVPLYQEIRGSLMTGHVEYQIVVVTRLAAFKNAKHKPGDVVQLVVSKKYSDIDEFYCSLAAQYPSVHLPAMPRKALFVSETDIRERRVAFDELVRFISKHPALSTCPELFEFLGAKHTVLDVNSSNTPDWVVEDDDSGLDFFGKDEAPNIEPERMKKPVKEEKAHEVEEDDDEEEELFDPLGGVRSKKPKATVTVAKPAVQPKLSLFDEWDEPDQQLFQPARKHNELKLFEDPDLGGTVSVGDSLLLPNAYQKTAASVLSQQDEDVDELFRVEDDLDKLLVINKPVRPKPAIAPKPQLAVKVKPVVPQKPSSLAQAGGAPPSGSAQAMGQLDILRYIQQNEAGASEDLDLF
ncbi:HCLS1-binding protein 3 [Brachyhypopomus gauderio]|uniref:HCLS1-binding protein 3 n=1 Tax=Brachyhypopomus gauderio TaxID=698409 RepID=UPI0040432EE2